MYLYIGTLTWYVPVCTRYILGMYLYIGTFHRYLGLFGDHIVPAVLYRYTQVLRRPDLINSKGKPLVTAARLGSVWKRLSSRFKTVVADTSMITLSNEYSIHFHDLYVDGKENAKLTGDRMKMLMLTLPFMVRDLITPEVLHCMHIMVCTSMYCADLCMYHVRTRLS
jgi:hypothetical protein